MVLAERGAGVGGGGGGAGGGAPATNGRRSRGPSPEGRATPSSSSEDENAERIRVGRDFQAMCPELEPPDGRRPELLADRALLVWSPTADIGDAKLDEYIRVAKEKYGYNGEQALGMLFWHKHDLDRAVLDLANFTPFPDEWTVEDKVLFDQAFAFHGKSFHRIRQMLPDKTIASLVKYYYGWKKNRARASQMDRTASATKRDGSPDRASDRASDDRESDADDKAGEGGGGREGRCVACGGPAARGPCDACRARARRVSRRGGPKQARFKHKLPRGIHVDRDDLAAMAAESRPPPDSDLSRGDDASRPRTLNRGEFMLKVMDREIVSLKRQVQINKQQIGALKRKNSDSIDELRPGETASKINSRWTHDELLLAVQGVRKYGKDFQAIAETIGTKTEGHVRTFWASYRRRYNLDSVLREWEAEKGGGSGPSSSVTLPTSPSSAENGADVNNGHSSANGDGVNDVGGNSSVMGASAGAIGRSNSPIVVKDDKMEVDSEGCALGSLAEQGGAPTTPSKPSKSSK